MDDLVLAGEPGLRWSNSTELVLWQLRCSFANSCGYCISLHHAISGGFPLPFHRRCRCIQDPIFPGAIALPWVDYRKVFSRLPKAKRRSAVGKSVDALIESGRITLDDAVLPGRPKSLEEIASEQGLSADDMIQAGVDPQIAERAAGQPALTDEQAEEAHRRRVRQRLERPRPESPVPPASEPRRLPTSYPSHLPPTPPADLLRAGNETLGKIMRNAGLEPVPLPDFHGDIDALPRWLYGTLPHSLVFRISPEDWTILLAAVEAQERLRKVFRRLGANEQKAMEAAAGQ